MKQIDTPEPSPSLIDVQLTFAHWRKTRTMRGLTPARLRRLAVDLLQRYRAVAICEALGVNAVALKQWAKLVIDEPDTEERPAAGFVMLTPDEEPVQHSEPCTVIINLPNGVQVHAHGAYTLSQVFAAASELRVNA